MKAENHILVIFGASGDLTVRKLIPALFDLFGQDDMPENFAVLGVARSPISDNDFRDKMKEGIKEHANLKEKNADRIEAFLSNLHYLSIDTSKKEDYTILKDRLLDLDKDINGHGNYLYYLATPPNMYEIIAQNLYSFDLHKENNSNEWKRIIVEKPFGYNLDSAKDLNKKLLDIFKEDQIYRIDHYLGKETVQNLLVFRFSNGFFEPIWNRNYIQQIEITAAESIGIEGRGGYYENAGALRDMVQNHLMQLVGLTALEPPSMFDANSLRSEMVKVFQALRPFTKENIPKQVILGQYVASETKDGKQNAYRDEKSVDVASKTETFVAMMFFIDNWRWADVPFFIRTGKRLPERVTEIVIHLKSTPLSLFQNQCQGASCNKLIIRIQPDESISMQIGLKTPGQGYRVKQVEMDFKYSDLNNVYIPSAYERLLLDCMLGDSTLFIRGDAVEATWKFIDPILELAKNDSNFKLFGYPSNSWGPKEAVNMTYWYKNSKKCKVIEAPYLEL